MSYYLSQWYSSMLFSGTPSKNCQRLKSSTTKMSGNVNGKGSISYNLVFFDHNHLQSYFFSWANFNDSIESTSVSLKCFKNSLPINDLQSGQPDKLMTYSLTPLSQIGISKVNFDFVIFQTSPLSLLDNVQKSVVFFVRFPEVTTYRPAPFKLFLNWTNISLIWEKTDMLYN